MSVLLPVRDAVATLEACLDSLAAQTLAAHEIVAVDDGSRDGSRELLLARARSEPRLRVEPMPKRGLVPALQRALALARAPVVARMDADDVAHPERLARQVARLEDEASLEILGCAVSAVGARPGQEAGEGMLRYVAWSNELLHHEQMAAQRFVESPLVHPSVALRAGTLRRLGGWRDFDGPEDYDLWLRAFDAGVRFAKLPELLLEWRDSPLRLTRSDPRYAAERFQRLKLEALVRGPLAGRAAVVWGAGPIGKSWVRALRAAGQPVAAFVEVNPRQIGRSIQGVPVLALDAVPAGGDGLLHLGAVGQPGARERVRDEAARRGLREGRDFYAVA